jgi:hypothetical protein
MFLNFFHEPKKSGIPVSVKEYLDFLNAVDAGAAADHEPDRGQAPSGRGRQPQARAFRQSSNCQQPVPDFSTQAKL